MNHRTMYVMWRTIQYKLIIAGSELVLKFCVSIEPSYRQVTYRTNLIQATESHAWQLHTNESLKMWKTISHVRRICLLLLFLLYTQRKTTVLLLNGHIVALFLNKYFDFWAILSIWYDWNCLFKLFQLILHTEF